MTVRQAMTFGSAKVTDVETLIDDETLALEQKYDGTRAICVVTRTVAEGLTIDFLARNGQPLKHAAAVQHFDTLKRAMKDSFPHVGETVLDGEIMIDSGAFILFDLPYAEREGVVHVKPEDTYRTRRNYLATLGPDLTQPISVGYMAIEPDEKRLLFKSVMEQYGEGVMAKSLVSPYVEGKRVKHSLKVKFVKTADVVVIDRTSGRNEAGNLSGSITFGIPVDEPKKKSVKIGDHWIEPLGNCSSIGKPVCEPGDVIEVRYLYRQAGGSLVQPTMLQVRPDRDVSSVGYDQFVDYSKAVVG